MKQFCLFSLISLLSLTLSAQVNAPGPNSGSKSLAVGHVYGKVVDASGKGISDATVVLMQSRFDSASKRTKETLVKGIATNAIGEFSLEDLPVNKPLKLKISATGYKSYEAPVAFQFKQDGFDNDLGNIKLAIDVKQLQEVTVTASKPMLRMDIDKKVFTVDKNIVSVGGTALDVMKNVPSVQVDIDGNVKLRNSAPQIFIEGRPTTLSLDQIPADAIESVEVITNPSAKYDASGGNAGILNIILKKNKKTGYNGNLRAGVDKRGGINGGGDFNLRDNKFNFTASVMTNRMKGVTTGTTDRLNYSDTPETHINQSNYNKMNGGFIFGRVGLDYFVTNRTTLSLSGIRVHGDFNPAETISINTDSLFDNGTRQSYSERNSTGNRTFNAKGLQFGMKHLFPTKGEELTADLNYFSGKNSNYSFYNTDYFTSANGDKNGFDQQKIMGAGTNNFLTVQTDYVKPFNGKTKLETGLRAQLRSLTNATSNYMLDHNSNEFVVIPSATSNYKNNDNVYAAYGSFTSAIKNFGYQVGLRAESSSYNGELTDTKEKFSNNYAVSLFPSLFLSEKLKGQQELQFSYTRRINRPNFFQLIPFIDYSDKLNITKGNPNLVPEFTNSAELSYSKSFQGNNNFLASIYYKKTNNLITRYLDKQINPVTGNEDLINTFINANSSQSFGTEFTSQNSVARWWDVTTNLNLYNSKINTSNINNQSQAAMWSWFGKLNNSFKLPSNFSIQLSAVYQSKTNLPVNSGGGGFGGPFGQAQSSSQGYIKANYGIDLAVKKDFLKNKAASISFSINDIFRTRRTDQYSYSQYFVQDYSRIRDPQMFRLNLSYRFGKLDMSLFKRKNTKSDMSGATDGMQQ